MPAVRGLADLLTKRQHWARLAEHLGRSGNLVLRPSDAEGTRAYKSAARADIEADGYRIVLNVGDQDSDLRGGHADKAYKLPNPFYFISD